MTQLEDVLATTAATLAGHGFSVAKACGPSAVAEAIAIPASVAANACVFMRYAVGGLFAVDERCALRVGAAVEFLLLFADSWICRQWAIAVCARQAQLS